MFEVAMIQIEEYCKINDIDMIGYYHANENTNDKELEPIAKKIVDKFSTELKVLTFLCVVDGGASTPREAVKKHVKEGKERLINDFEDYLSNPTLDWLNK
eukprot:gene17759-21182_t